MKPSEYEIRVQGDKIFIEISATANRNELDQLRYKIEDFLKSLEPDKSDITKDYVE
jgi:hypothetical protein